MSKTIKFTITDDQYNEICSEYESSGFVSIQDFLRFKLFNEKPVFYINEIVEKALLKNKGETFTLKDICNFDFGYKTGVYAKKFRRYVEEHKDLGIVPTDTFSKDNFLIYKIV